MIATDFAVDVADGPIAIRDYGGDGVPVLLIHGNGHNACSWDYVGPMLARDFRVAAFDLRGFGQSTAGPSMAMDSHFGDLEAVVGALGVNMPVLVGHSMGASVAFAYAAARGRCRKVVSVDLFWGSWDPSYPPIDGWAEHEARIRSEYGQLDFVGTHEEALAAAARETEELAQLLAAGKVSDAGLLALMGRVFERGYRQVGERFRRSFGVEEYVETVRAWEYDLRPTAELYEKVACKVLVVAASRWTLGGHREEVQRMVDQLGFDLVWLPGHHLLPMQMPRELSECIRDWVAS